MHIFIDQLFDLYHHLDHIINWKHIFIQSYHFQHQSIVLDTILLKKTKIKLYIHNIFIVLTVIKETIMRYFFFFFLTQYKFNLERSSLLSNILYVFYDALRFFLLLYKTIMSVILYTNTSKERLAEEHFWSTGLI
jgi:hypothetical protein